MEETIIEKKCSRCKLVKPISEFNKDKKATVGFQSCCKDCSNKAYKLWVEKNKDKMKEYQKEYRLMHKKNKETDNNKEEITLE